MSMFVLNFCSKPNPNWNEFSTERKFVPECYLFWFSITRNPKNSNWTVYPYRNCPCLNCFLRSFKDLVCSSSPSLNHALQELVMIPVFQLPEKWKLLHLWMLVECFFFLSINWLCLIWKEPTKASNLKVSDFPLNLKNSKLKQTMP